MSQNFVAPGNTATVQASPRAVAGGDGLLVGAMFGVAVNDAALNEEVVLQLAGVFTLPRGGSTAINQGVRMYWDDAAHNVTGTATSNTLIGVTADPVAASAPTANVRLNAAF